MNVESVLYIDKKGREILHVPGNFVFINYMKREPEVIFDLRRLRIWERNWNTGKASLGEFIGNPEIEQEDLDDIIGLVFEEKIDLAKSYCVDLFDDVANRQYGIDSETRRRRWE